MSKRKFEIGDKVVIAPKYKNRYNCLTTVGEVIYVGSSGARSLYQVTFEDKATIFNFYSYELVFADIHALAEHCSKELKKQEKQSSKATKCKYCGEKFDDEVYCGESKDEPGVCEWCADQRKKMPKIHNRRSVVVDIKDFSIFGKDGDWLEVTEWTNGEGIDIDIHYNSDHEEDIRKFQLSYDELSIIMNIVNKFGYLPTIFTDPEEDEELITEIN